MTYKKNKTRAFKEKQYQQKSGNIQEKLMVENCKNIQEMRKNSTKN